MTEGRRAALARRWAHRRDKLRQRPAADMTYRIAVGVIGTVVFAVGIVAIPYPGPGWAIVFVGLGILATEFDWAQRLLARVRERYDAVMDWFKSQGLWVQVLGVAFTALIVVGTLWLFGALKLAAGLVGIEQAWLQSPIGIGS